MPLQITRTCTLVLAMVIAPLAQADQRLVWFDAGRPAPQAQQAIALLRSAPAQGLDADDYQSEQLAQALARARQEPGGTTNDLALLDAALTGAVMRYLQDLQTGRIDPHTIHARFALPPRAAPDLATLLGPAITAQRLPELAQQLTPVVPMAGHLLAALAHYRTLVGHAAWHNPLPAPAGGKLEPGQTYPGFSTLAGRLMALGDLPIGTPVPDYFDSLLVEALRRFQERHGLEADGVLGRLTREQLGVAPARRVRQIELALERLRWTPLLQSPRMVVVNVPEFVLRAYEVRGDQVDVRLTMRIIVGKALDTRTPLFQEDMRFIEFSPYWNVPPSIARQELIPRLRSDPAYFARQGFEFVTDKREVVTLLEPGHLDAVREGRWRIRQRPGPLNALGDIKFVMPNNANVYLHHTPTPALFERARRDLSHGCIRIEAPLALAAFVLQDDPAWTPDRIRQAMGEGTSRTLRLQRPLPVLIAYSTVVVKGGRIHFFPDLYGHDALLDRALRARSATLVRHPLPAAALR